MPMFESIGLSHAPSHTPPHPRARPTSCSRPVEKPIDPCCPDPFCAILDEPTLLIGNNAPWGQQRSPDRRLLACRHHKRRFFHQAVPRYENLFAFNCQQHASIPASTHILMQRPSPLRRPLRPRRAQEACPKHVRPSRLGSQSRGWVAKCAATQPPH